MIKHKFKKEYGQNFLVGKNFAFELVDALDIQPTDTVIEIGPGDGMVTNIILDLNPDIKLFCIEIDYDLLPNLIKRFSSKENFKLIHRDILEINFEEFIQEHNISGDIKIIGSLPYNISKKIIDRFLTYSTSLNGNTQITRMSFIIQEEVAKDYVAQPPKSTFLSNYVKFFGDARKLKSIPAHKFYPMPKVNGAILQFILNGKIAPDTDQKRKFIKAGFVSPRKTLYRNLRNLPQFNKSDLMTIFKEIGISEKSRPAELSFDQWNRLYDLITQS